MKTFLCASSALLGVFISTAAFAQETQLGEIVVTAQRREESLQRAAVSVAAVSGDQVQQAGVSQAQDLTRLVPSLQVAQSAAPNVLVSLRGISNFSVNPFGDSSVAFNYDGVFVARTTAVAGVFYDLERVEVVKGPQGILYGRNATGGAINVLPRTPELGKFGGSITAGVGNYDLVQATAAVNIPIGDTVAVRAAFNTVKRDGYLSDGHSDEDGDAARVQLKWSPNEDLSVRLGADYFKLGGKGPGSTLLNVNGAPILGDLYIGLGDPRSCTGSPGQDLNYYYGAANCRRFTEGSVDNTYWGVNGTVDWTTPIGDLTVIAGHRDTDVDSDLRASPVIIQKDRVKQDSLEARLASSDEHALRWLVGAYYFKEREHGSYNIDLVNGVLLNQPLNLGTESWAAFGQLTFAVSETLRFTAGARYTEEEKTTDSQSIVRLPAFGLVLGATPIKGKRSWDNTDWRVGVEWNVAPESLLYANVGTGFRSGGFFFAPSNFSYDPEYITAYSIGTKNRFLDGNLLLNAELYRYEYEDQQISHAKNIGGVNYFPTENVGQAVLQGVEIDTIFRAAEHTVLSANVQYLDAKYEDFRYSQPLGNATACARRPIGPTDEEVNCTGKRPPFSPEWTLNAAVEQTFPLSNGRSLVANLSGHYQSESVTTIEYLPFQLIGDWYTLDASLSFRDERGWSITGWVNNLTDESIEATKSGTGDLVSPRVANVRPPRTYGVRVSAEF